MTLTRRNLLGRSAVGAGLAATGNLAALIAGTCASASAFASGNGSPAAGAYGELITDPAGLLDLPPGFSYTVVSRAGEVMQRAEPRRSPRSVRGRGRAAPGHAPRARVRGTTRPSAAAPPRA